ncbi:MAG: class IV adenylate cyclase [Chloroflexi bacterium]|nr:class IV adenylate cyclase [Chloroflexota bacterium]
MPEQQEIEIKFHLTDPLAFRQQVLQTGARSRGEPVAEYNIRLDDAAGVLAQQDIVLRVRSTSADDEGLVTVKLPVPDTDPTFKIVKEIEFMVSDRHAMVEMLAVLGYRPAWIYEKRREKLDWRGVQICLDEMPMGWFAELEGSEAGIRALAAELNLDLADGITLTYAQLFEHVRQSLKLSMTDLTFEAFTEVIVSPDVFSKTNLSARLSE